MRRRQRKPNRDKAVLFYRFKKTETHEAWDTAHAWCCFHAKKKIIFNRAHSFIIYVVTSHKINGLCRQTTFCRWRVRIKNNKKINFSTFPSSKWFSWLHFAIYKCRSRSKWHSAIRGRSPFYTPWEIRHIVGRRALWPSTTVKCENRTWINLSRWHIWLLSIMLLLYGFDVLALDASVRFSQAKQSMFFVCIA